MTTRRLRLPRGDQRGCAQTPQTVHEIYLDATRNDARARILRSLAERCRRARDARADASASTA